MQCLGRRILFSISPSPIKLVVQSVQKTTLLYENFCKRTSEALFSYYCSRISNCFRRLEERAVEVRLDSGLLRQALHNVHTLQNSADHQVGLVQQLSVFEVRVWEGGGGDAPSCAVGARQRGLRDLHQLSVHKLKFRPRLLTLAALQPHNHGDKSCRGVSQGSLVHLNLKVLCRFPSCDLRLTGPVGQFTHANILNKVLCELMKGASPIPHPLFVLRKVKESLCSYWGLLSKHPHYNATQLSAIHGDVKISLPCDLRVPLRKSSTIV
mmetsp:Transcript_32713/g.45395  ORF Transcript_32713/g.45395 Transcript_32713/m.45395 type:complete len:267 (+) Transcript_32713:219-1019(+)